VLRVMLVAYAINLIGLAFTPGPVDAGFSELEGAVDNPLGLPGAWRHAIEVITGLAGLIVLAGGLISIISLIQRFRRAPEVERQQIRWLLFLTAFLGGLLTTTLLLQLIGVLPEDEESVIGNAIFFVFIVGLFIGIPVTSAIAILRDRLYDLDLVVKKTILYFVLVALIVVVASLGAFSTRRPVRRGRSLSGLADADRRRGRRPPVAAPASRGQDLRSPRLRRTDDLV
jgi:hypothetical protein